MDKEAFFWNTPADEDKFVPKSTTLVLHPDDSSTHFLKPIYSGKGYDVLNQYHGDMHSLIKQYERVIMMGHGWTPGMFSKGRFPGEFAIDSSTVPFLKGKDNAYIWCMASDFVSQHGLKGFSTGMFISEVEEASWFGMIVDQDEIDYSNDLFASIMSKQIENPNLGTILKTYDGDSPIIQYNRSLMRMF